MLQSLKITNAALISELNIPLSGGLNILSGETGAGKSIIIDSLNFVLGSKADKSLIRHGTDRMTAEAVFFLDESFLSLDEFSDLGIDEQTVIIFRTFGMDGRGEVRINGRAATLSMLKSLSARLVDVYGQSEHISLLSSSVQLDIIDNFNRAETAPLMSTLGKLCLQLKDIDKQLLQFGGSDRERERLIELYSYQSQEIEDAALSIGEEQNLRQLQTKYINQQRITEDVNLASSAIGGEQGSACDTVSAALMSMQRAARYDSALEGLSERLDSVRLELDDIFESVSEYLFSSEYDEREAAATENRLELIKSLKRKYGDSEQQIFEYKADIDQKLSLLTQSAELINKLSDNKQRVLTQIYDVSLRLSDVRKKSAQGFTALVMENLSQLNMKGTKFDIEFSPFPALSETGLHASARGMDSVEFLIAPNAGQPLKPLSKIISGGEMSRFMLAVKNITRDTDNIPTLIFDEIDTGISGETAMSVAKKFADISRGCQVIAITHLPQIAAMGDCNFLIKKSLSGDTTITEVKRVTGAEQADEIARLIGAADVSEHASLHAERLIAWSKDYKQQLKLKAK